MSSDNPESKIEQLKRAIAAQEGMRGVLDETIIDTTLAALRAQLAELEARSAPEQQRKLMTVLFVDVVGSTQMMRGRDPEEVLNIMDAALERLAGPIEARGGRVLRFMGDGYLAAFGLPVARENDPEMAVRAGLDVLKVAETIAVDLEKRNQIKGFRVRIGVNTDLVVAGGLTEGGDTIMGPAVNLAARLESAAPSGGLLISYNTYRHVRGLFEVEPQAPIAVKGFVEPVETFLVREAQQFTFDLTTRGVEGVETQMIGRETELATLQQALADVAAGKGARFVTVIGEAGLGKSRLLAEFEQWLATQRGAIELFKSRATLETLNSPYRLLRDLLATRIGILENDSIARVRMKLEDAFRFIDPESAYFERNAHFVGQLLGYDFGDSPHLQTVLGDPRQIRDRALAYLREFFMAHAEASSIIIFLDDLHWADSSSLDLLSLLFDELKGEPLLVIALSRQSLLERRPNWGELAGHQRLLLRPLTRLQAERLVTDVLQKVQDLPARLRDLVIDSADGNPFYLEELIKMLVEDGVIVKGEPRWSIRNDLLGAVRIPPTLTGVIQARLDSLPREQRQTLRQASVVGRVFWDETVCHIGQDEAHGDLDADEIKHYLSRLEDREMIYRQVSSAFSDVHEYLFKHVILRDVAYESVLKRVRRTYHALTAEWLIAHSGDRIDEVSGLIAGHLENAGNIEQALKYWQRAAELARSNYANAEAIDLYTRALALVPEEDLEGRYVLLKGRTSVLEHQGNRVAQRRDLESRAAIADVLRDDRKQVEVANERAWLAFFVGEYAEAIAFAKRTIELADPSGPSDHLAEAHRILVWANRQLADFETALRHAEVNLALAQEGGDRSVLEKAQSTSAILQLALGNYSATREHSEKALILSAELGNMNAEATSLCNAGVVLTVLGEYDAAEIKYQRGLLIARETRNRSIEVTALINLGWTNAARGKWQRAREYAAAGAELSREIAYVEALAESLMWLGHSWLGLGRPEDAISSYEEALAIRRDLGQTNLAMGATAGLARATLATGDRVAALDHVEEILKHFADGGSLTGTWEPLRIRLVCYQVLAAVDDPRAEAVLNEAFDDLQERAARIMDANDRRSYLENVPWHREIVAVWNKKSAQ
jgi:predicted ATPase/class 3 adenylate cyclase